MVDASSVQYFGSQEHRMKVSQTIKESLLARNTRRESLTSAQTARHQNSNIKWELPGRDMMFEASKTPKADHKDSQVKEDCRSLLAPIQLYPDRTLQPQYYLSQEVTSAARPTLSPLSPPLSHTRSSLPLPISQSECVQRESCSLSPPTPLSPCSKLPWYSHSLEQPYRQRQLVTHPAFHEVHDSHEPFDANVEWEPVPKHPDGANLDEIISLMDSEVALHDIREKYEEAIARGLLARHNATFVRRQREIRILQSRIGRRRRI